MKNKAKILEGIEIFDVDPKGNGRAKFEGRTVLVENALPGEVVDAKVMRRLKGKWLARPFNFHNTSDSRAEPFCEHFEICGGCKWQHVSYGAQTEFKTNFVRKAFDANNVTEVPVFKLIIGSSNTRYYRNRLDFSFSNKRWLTWEELDSGEEFTNLEGLGFHPAGAYDKVIDLKNCYLQPDPSNDIRLAIREFALANEMPFYDIRHQQGWLRNLTIRNNLAGDVMIILSIFNRDDEKLDLLFGDLQERFPQVTSLWYLLNDTGNDSLYDKEVVHYAGDEFLTETFGDVQYRIGPKSFFQTNTEQAKILYDVAVEMADLQGHETVYDLYTGTGTIALYVAKQCKEVIGIEFVEAAIEDAKKNAELNSIDNTQFYAGDMKDVLNDQFLKNHPQPDVLITDPPRAGMHKSVVQMIRKIAAKKVVYVSCNPVTQAIDLEQLQDMYTITAVQPVDMFPQTYHVENVVRLDLKG